jgi:hypothetical protein
MDRAATVPVPPHNHGRLLRLAVESALAQTVQDIEVFIVGDGPTGETEETAPALDQADARVRFFNNPKGERHGELHRHAALQEAAGSIVCYLSDDDLWLPDHVEYLSSLLADHDFAHSLPVFVRPDDTLHVYPGNLENGWWRRFVLEEGNFIPLQTSGHTMDLYRRLPHGWRPGPEDVWSDVHMWRQTLSVPGCRAVSGTRPTSLHLTSARRTEADADERLAELASWARRVAEPAGREQIRHEVADALAVQLAGARARELRLERKLERITELEAVRAERREARAHKLQRRVERAENQTAALKNTLTWRLRGRILSLPLVGGLIRMAGRARSRRAGR